MTPRTSAAEVNRLSCSNGVWGLDEGSDHAQILGSDWIHPNQINDYLNVADRAAYSSLLKLCDHSVGPDYSGTPLIIPQGRENAVDMNNVAWAIRIKAEFGRPGQEGDQVITVKGGCSGIWLMGTIYSRGRNADYVQDAWSDQSAALCSEIDLSGLVRADGQPVTIILGRFGSKVAAYPASYRVLFWKSLGYSLYHVGKSAAVKLGLIKGIK